MPLLSGCKLICKVHNEATRCVLLLLLILSRFSKYLVFQPLQLVDHLFGHLGRPPLSGNMAINNRVPHSTRNLPPNPVFAAVSEAHDLASVLPLLVKKMRHYATQAGGL